MASHRMKLWTASAFAVALLSGLGCQARYFSQAGRSTLQNQPARLAARNHSAAEDRVTLPATSRYWSSTPTARVFRGSVSAVSDPDELAAR